MGKQDSDKKIEMSPIVEVASTFHLAFDELGIKVSPIDCEVLGRFISAVYGTRNRAFHDVGHATEVSLKCGPLSTLAGLFHDVVYKQIDQARLIEVRSLFGVFDPGESLELTIPADEILARDPWRRAIVYIFGFKAGQKLGPFTGMNEFLSAWVAIQKLNKLLSPAQMLHVIACIELTIPFRGEQDNPSVPEKLKANVQSAAKLLQVKMSNQEVDEIVLEAVKLSNNDIKGFGRETPEVFIYNSWALLYEGNPALQNNYYTVTKYREPLQKLLGFMSTLNPKKVFYQYMGYPSETEIRELHSGINHNLHIATEYVRAKLLDVAIIEAFALISGGDCPLELFTGTKAKSRESRALRIEDFLVKEFVLQNAIPRNDEVRKLLVDGRAFRSKFDVKTSLLTAFVYDSLTETQFNEAFEAAREMFKQQLSPENFLELLPNDLVEHIGQSLKKMAWTRAEAIQNYLNTRISNIRAA